MITSGEISVVVQGPIVGGPDDPPERRHTLNTLESVRRHLPHAEIVLSTWAGSDVTGLPHDRLVLSEDPGTIRSDDGSWLGGFPYNANRLIVSTRNGLRAATRPYAVKMRSDLLLTGTGFIGYFGRYPARADSWRVLRERVVACTCYSRNPSRRLAYPFHPSDWFHFGLREDLQELWEIPLSTGETARWFDTRPRLADDTERWATYRYTVEQYVWTSFLRKHGTVPFDHKLDRSRDAVALSELTIANNLVLVEPERLGIVFVKYRVALFDWLTLYTHGEWQRMYRRFCDPAFRPDAEPAVWLRRTRAAVTIGAAHKVLSPRSSRAGQLLSTEWEKRFPASFQAARRSLVWVADTARGLRKRPPPAAAPASELPMPPRDLAPSQELAGPRDISAGTRA